MRVWARNVILRLLLHEFATHSGAFNLPENVHDFIQWMCGLLSLR